jgi:diguanylate cyclase (GGDEF)-like protein
MFGLDASLLPSRAGGFLPRRFPAALEADYVNFSLRVFRPGIRAWHTAALGMAAVLLLIAAGLHLVGSAYPAMPAKSWLFGLALATRATLCWLAWRADFESLYARAALPLALCGHACINYLFASEVFGPHPGFLVAIAVYAFAAGFLTGLRFQQSVLVNGVALGVLVGYAWQQPLPGAAVWSVIAHIGFAMVVASIVAVTLEQAVRALFLENRRVGEMAARDGLTGLKNRRAFDEHLAQVWQLALRDRCALGVLLIDVDFFKSFNDNLGHQAGDAALQRIATVVADTARRPLDLAARYGGEELAVILFDVTREYVAEMAARVQAAVVELNIQHPRSAVAPMVTVSTGVAFVRPTPERSPQGAVLLADRCLYAAKRAGRNRSTMRDRDEAANGTGVFAEILRPI